MKKKILSLAILAISTFTVTTIAQQPQGCPECKEVKECCKAKKQRHSRPDMFAGLNLTDSQKSRLAEIDRKERASRPDSAAVARHKERRGARPDSAAMAARRQARIDYLKQVKEILTPEQYVTFLENSFTNPGKSASMKHGKFAAKRHGKKQGFRPDMKRGGNRGEKTAPQARR